MVIRDSIKNKIIKKFELVLIRIFEKIIVEIKIALLINVHFKCESACKPPQNNLGIKKNQIKDNEYITLPNKIEMIKIINIVDKIDNSNSKL